MIGVPGCVHMMTSSAQPPDMEEWAAEVNVLAHRHWLWNELAMWSAIIQLWINQNLSSLQKMKNANKLRIG